MICPECKEECEALEFRADYDERSFCSSICRAAAGPIPFRPAASPPVVETKPTNPKNRAASNRLDLTLFPDSAVAYGALAFTEGDCKYGGYNWRAMGVQSSIYYAAMRRHMAKWFNGEDTDPKTGVPHLANALACIAVLIDSIEQGNLNDDRPPRQQHAELYSYFESAVERLHRLYPNGPPRHRASE